MVTEQPPLVPASHQYSTASVSSHVSFWINVTPKYVLFCFCSMVLLMMIKSTGCDYIYELQQATGLLFTSGDMLAQKTMVE
jgi:hypothetical protein